MAMSKKEVARSAITGKFVTETYANNHPKTTVVEHIYVPKPKKAK